MVVQRKEVGLWGLGYIVSVSFCAWLERDQFHHLPVGFFFHVRGVAVAVVRQEKPPIVQPVYVDLDVGAVHYDDVGCQGLPGHLSEAAEMKQPFLLSFQREVQT